MGLMGADGTRRAAQKRIEPEPGLGLRRRDAGQCQTRGYNRLQPRPFFSKGGGAIKRAVLPLPNLAAFAQRFGGKEPCDDLPPSAAPANARAPRRVAFAPRPWAFDWDRPSCAHSLLAFDGPGAKNGADAGRRRKKP